MIRLLGCGLAISLLLSPQLAGAQTAGAAPVAGRSEVVPQLKLELLDKSFAIGGIADDAAHQARFQVTATTGGMRASDGSWGEKMVGFRVPIPQIVGGGGGLFGMVGDDSPGAPRVFMTQPLTDEDGIARGFVLSGQRQDDVRLGYPGAIIERGEDGEENEIRAVWNETGAGWDSSRILALDKANNFIYSMAFERDGKQLPIRGHRMKFYTTGLAGQLWRSDFGPDLDGDGRPDGDYVVTNFTAPDSNEAALSRPLDAKEFEKLSKWQPLATRGDAGAYSSQAVVRADPRFVVDALRIQVWDDNAYEVAGSLEASNDPRRLQPRPLQLEKSGPAAPKVWDRATVARLLRDIEKPRNAALLRGLYFGAHRSHALPAKEGRKLLQAAANAAKPNSRRWFLLMSLRGFAELRADENKGAKGFAAYRALFGAADKAPAARSQTIVRAAIADFVNIAPVGYDQYELSGAPGDNTATIAAWKAYSQSQNWPQTAAERADKPNWSLKWQEEGIPTALPLYVARQSALIRNAPLDWRFAAASALSAGNQQQAAFALWSRIKTELSANDLDRLNIVYQQLDENLS